MTRNNRDDTSITEDFYEENSLRKSKYIYVFINSVILIIAISLTYLMINLDNFWYYFEPFFLVYSKNYSISVVFTTFPVMMLTVFSFIVTCSEKRICFVWYGIFLTLMIISELQLLVHGFLKSEAAANEVHDKMMFAIGKYTNDSRLTHSMDLVQLSLNCCGVNDYTDWHNYSIINDLPPSCCPYSQTFPSCVDGKIFQNSCLPLMLRIAEVSTKLIQYIICILICFKVLSIMMCTTIYYKSPR